MQKTVKSKIYSKKDNSPRSMNSMTIVTPKSKFVLKINNQNKPVKYFPCDSLSNVPKSNFTEQLQKLNLVAPLKKEISKTIDSSNISSSNVSIEE